MTEELRSYLLEQGADLAGFGGTGRLDGAPPAMHPQRYLPGARSMIAIGLRVNQAVCDLIARHARGAGQPPSYHSYQLHTLVIINRELDRIAYLGAKYLEGRGFRAYPFPANVPHLMKPTKEYPGGPGDVSHRHIAVACGLGRIGWHGLLLTPRFNARQKLVSIVTNAPLGEDPVYEQVLCDPEACGFQCASVCPAGAIPADIGRSTSCVIGGSVEISGKLAGWRCRWGCSGMLKSTGGYRDIPIPDEEPDEEELLRYKGLMDPWQQRVGRYTGLVPYCGRCFSVCRGSGRRADRAGTAWR